MSYVKSVPLKKLFQYTQDDDEVVLLASTNEQPEDAAQLADALSSEITVDNAAVNSAIADNKAATREVIGSALAKGVYYATDYGCLADGTTDDTQAIQDCINAAYAAGGGVVELPIGVIRVGKTTEETVYPGGGVYPTVGHQNKWAIQLKQGVSLKGQGIGQTIIKPLDNISNSTYDMPIIFAHAISPATRITDFFISDLTIDGYKSRFGGDGEGGEDEGINVYGGDRVVIQNVEIKDCGQNGIDFDGVVTNCTNTLITNCVVSGCFSSGIHMEVDGMVIANCIVENNAHGAAAVGGGATYPHEAGIECGQSTEVVISGCYFENNNMDCLVPSAYIVGNTFINSGRTCIAVTKNTTGVIASNRIRALGAATAIGIDIKIVGVASAVFLISGNEITSNGIGIKATNSGAFRVIGNYINASSYAVQLVNTNANRVELLSNSINTPTNGLRVDCSGGGIASGNTINTSNGVVAIDLRSNSDNWVISSNYFPTSGIVGLRIFDSATTGITFKGNIGDYDISVNSINNRFEGNLIRNVTVNASASSGNIFVNNEITGTVTHNTVTYASNTWRGNYGAAMAGVFYGTATLSSGTATVSTAAANSARKFAFNRQAPNASTAIGHLALGTITAQTSFVVNALNASATVETGDVSTVYWQIIE